MTEEEFRSLHQRLRARLTWGPDDRRGALNHLTPAETRAACDEVRLGLAVSLAAPIEGRVTADNPEPAQHRMTGPSAAAAGRGLAFGMDRLALNIHGNADSHMDALCHAIFDGELYNGVPADTITDGGATELSIALAADGIVGRGVLLDVPRSRGVPWLEPGDSAAARAGLHPGVVPMLAERQIAVLGSDGNSDTAPSVTDGVDFPVHVLAINALGLMMLDYLQLGDLVPACERAGRWSFLCLIAPLRLPTGTGSPVNPIAVL